MKLKAYLKEFNITVTDFAVRIGRSREAVYGLLRGDTDPSPETIRTIIRVTKGKVTANDFFPVPYRNTAEMDAAS